jgi:Concanavalin A-like lectin/glucanases superfamily/Chitobiase/beta-hexosaminidase C-terminal domain
VSTAGAHTVNVWMRESGTVVDRVVLTKNATFNPSTINGGLGPVESGTAGPTVESPMISPNGGVFTDPVNVSLSTGTAGAAIHYTVDGSNPTTASTLYTAPFQVSVVTTVKARAILEGYNDSPVSSAVFQISPAGLIDYWKLDETSGSSYTNVVSGNPSATCTACPTPVAGRIGGAQQFDGMTNQINVADHNSFDWSNSERISIEAWIKRSSPCSVTGETIIGRRDSSSMLEWSLGCEGSNAKFTLIDTTGTGAGADLLGTTDIADGEWHHVVAVRDVISGNNLLYVDGVEEASTSLNYAGDFVGGTSLNIGWLNQGGSDYHFAGAIDEVAIHDRVLPDSEIPPHYADGTVGLQRGYRGAEHRCAFCRSAIRSPGTGIPDTGRGCILIWLALA